MSFVGAFQGRGGAAGSADLTIGSLTVVGGATGVVGQLASTLPGAITFSRVSGGSTTVAADGAVTFTAGLATGQARTIVARVANTEGRAIERAFVLTAIGAPSADFTISGAGVSPGLGQGFDVVGTITLTNAPAGARVVLPNEDAGFAIVEA